MQNDFSEVQVVPIKPIEGLVGFASIILNGNFYLGGIGIHTRPQGGYRLTYPTKKNQRGEINIFYPINKVTAEQIEQTIISRFKEIEKLYT